MASSLDNLVKILPKDNLKHIGKFFTKDNDIKLMLRKGVFCYDFLDSFHKLKQNKLPEQKYFYSKLYNQHISDDDYRHACKVWNNFHC